QQRGLFGCRLEAKTHGQSLAGRQRSDADAKGASATRSRSNSGTTKTGQGAHRTTFVTVLRRNNPHEPTAPWLAMMIMSALVSFASLTIWRYGLPEATTMSVAISSPQITST